MKVLLICLPLVAIVGCVQPTHSTGFLSPGKTVHLPAGVPQRVAVFVSGKPSLSGQAAELFSTGLLELGFDVVERNKIAALTDEMNLSKDGFISAETAIAKGQLLGADGVFVGNASGERSPTWTDTHLSLRLIQTVTGKTVWSVNAHDPRLMAVSMAEETSIIYTTKAALKALQNDLSKMKSDSP